MTLIAGFTGFGGVALCADSQETVGDYSKRTVEKVRTLQRAGVIIAFAGAGPGHFVDLVSQQFINRLEALQGELTPITVTAGLEAVLSDYHEKHVWNRPDSGSARIEFLMVYMGNGDPLLFHAAETAVTWVEGGYKTVGVGCHLADFMFEHIYTSRGDRWHMLAVGKYVLNKVAEYIEGVGKGTSVTIFTRQGELFFYPGYSTQGDPLPGVFSEWDKMAKQAFLGITDVCRRDITGNSFFKHELDDAVSEMQSLRAQMIELAEEEEAERRKVDAWIKSAS